MSVHSTHCCKIHGCKYGNTYCPVEIGIEEGVYCELCNLEKEKYCGYDLPEDFDYNQAIFSYLQKNLSIDLRISSNYVRVKLLLTNPKTGKQEEISFDQEELP